MAPREHCKHPAHFTDGESEAWLFVAVTKYLRKITEENFILAQDFRG
jgi:hypothetical protein